MKANRLQEKLAAGEMPLGHMIMEFGARSIARLLEQAGLDFVLIDTEHSAFSSSQMADLLAWLNATPLAPFVRIPEIQYHFIARTLDMGALGIMVPNVTSAAQARTLVTAAKYPPEGERGLILGNANTNFEAVDGAEFMAQSNRNTTIICQIESVQGLENLDAIAAVPGVDILWVGQGDLTKSQGIPNQFDHPRFLAALHDIVAAARRHNIAAGAQPRNLDQAQEWVEIGFNVISYGSDYALYLSALSAAVASFRQLQHRAGL